MSESYKVYASQEYVDNKFNDVSGLPSGSKSNQYLVTDSEGDVKWEDKLCWSETAEEVVQPECHPELVANEDILNHFYIDGVASITVGETYIVNWNGVDYRCVAKAPDMVSYGIDPVYAILGNIAKFEETGDTGEPFVIRVGRYDNSELSVYQIYGFDGSTELTLSILHYVETINKLSGKYVEGMGWSEKTKKVVLPETFVAEPAQQGGGSNGYIINSVLDSEKKYTVIYNGVAYDVISHTFSESMVAMGNTVLMGFGTDTGEPFVIAHNPDTGITMVGSLDGDGITIAIYEGEVETIHPIDKKYLPSGFGLPAGSKPNQYIVTDGEGNAKWEDRPFYEETVTTIILDEREVTTTPNESYGGINDGTLCTLAELYDAVLNAGDASFTVYLNGEKYKDLTFDGNMLGDESFETYPFCIALVDPVLIATKTSGTHTIKIEAVTKEKTVHLGSGLVFSTDWDADRNPFLSLEQVSAIKKAYEAGVAVQLYTNYENKGVIATVHDASHGFIRAFSIETDVRGCVEMVAYTFRVSDGGIERCYRSIGGTITENGDKLPVMCIKNRYYKVSVNSDGALIATEITA